MKSRLKKVAATDGWKVFDSFMLKSGDMVSISTSMINKKPWFQVTHDSDYNVSSYYDGDNKETAVGYYVELLMAFKGVSAAEGFNKTKLPLLNILTEKMTSVTDTNVKPLKQQPLFLGLNPF